MWPIVYATATWKIPNENTLQRLMPTYFCESVKPTNQQPENEEKDQNQTNANKEKIHTNVTKLDHV